MCTQEPLARLPNLFSVITVILLINMPIPFKFDSGFEKVFKTLHTCQQYTQYRFLIIIFLVNIKKENYKEKKNMQAKTKQAKRHKTHWKVFVSLPGIEPYSSVLITTLTVLQQLWCTNCDI